MTMATSTKVPKIPKMVQTSSTTWDPVPPAPAETPTATPTGENVVTFEGLQQRVVLLLLTMRAMGTERVVRDPSKVLYNKSGTNAEVLSVQKELLNSDEQHAITVLDGQIAAYVRRKSLPSPFKSGTYAVPLKMFVEIDDQLTAYAAQRLAKLNTFLVAKDGETESPYEKAKAIAKEKLGPEYDEDQYPTEDEIRAAYKMEWQFVTLAAPDTLKALAPEAYKREEARLKSQWTEAIDDMRAALREGLGELVNDLTSRLDLKADADAEGKKKTFKPSKKLEQFQDFLASFEARNVTNDAALTKLAEDAREILKGVNTKNLVESGSVRDKVREGFKKVKAQIAQLELETKSTRKFSFSDE